MRELILTCHLLVIFCKCVLAKSSSFIATVNQVWHFDFLCLNCLATGLNLYYFQFEMYHMELYGDFNYIIHLAIGCDTAP